MEEFTLGHRIAIHLKELESEHGVQFIRELFDVFSASAVIRVAKIISFHEVKNEVAAKLELHALKSGALTIGALDLGILCGQLENQNQLTNDSQWVEQLQKELGLVLEAIQDIKSKKIFHMNQASPNQEERPSY